LTTFNIFYVTIESILYSDYPIFQTRFEICRLQLLNDLLINEVKSNLVYNNLWNGIHTP